jgi:hypothetical protein
MEETITIRRTELRPARRLTTQYAPAKPLVWPWLAALALVMGLAAIGKPFDPTRTELSESAGDVLRSLP